MFSEGQLGQLRSFPEITSDELIRYLHADGGYLAFVSPGGRGSVDRLGMLVQLCTLPWLGFVPDDVTAAPAAAVARVAERLGVTPMALLLYGKRDQTCSDRPRTPTTCWRRPRSSSPGPQPNGQLLRRHQRRDPHRTRQAGCRRLPAAAVLRTHRHPSSVMTGQRSSEHEKRDLP
ncbi:DUF4158 domain-containing protein [Nonomuraea pusilla]